jgi:hypothetical protein
MQIMDLLRILLLALLPACLHAQQPMPRSTDAQIMQEARPVASSGRVDLYEHRISIDPELATLSDRAITQMEAILGRHWDTRTLGERVSVFVSSETRVSHVLGGYEHQNDPRPILFLNPLVARMALVGKNATYAHELAHLLTWRFHSHTLREGLADFLALQLHPGAAVGPNRAGYSSFPPLAEGVAELLGTSAVPPPILTQDQAFRESYYASSYRLVRHLIEVGGLPKFLELYAARNPESAFKQLYGQDRSTLVAAALK